MLLIGLMWDGDHRRLYIFPLPMFGFHVEFSRHPGGGARDTCATMFGSMRSSAATLQLQHGTPMDFDNKSERGLIIPTGYRELKENEEGQSGDFWSHWKCLRWAQVIGTGKTPGFTYIRKNNS